MSGVLTVTDATFAREIERRDGLAMVQFKAAWCAPCRLMAPVVDRIAAEQPAVRVARIDVDEEPATAARYAVRALPTVVFFRDGTEVGRIVGAQPRARLEDRLLHHAA